MPMRVEMVCFVYVYVVGRSVGGRCGRAMRCMHNQNKKDNTTTQYTDRARTTKMIQIRQRRMGTSIYIELNANIRS